MLLLAISPFYGPGSPSSNNDNALLKPLQMRMGTIRKWSSLLLQLQVLMTWIPIADRFSCKTNSRWSFFHPEQSLINPRYHIEHRFISACVSQFSMPLKPTNSPKILLIIACFIIIQTRNSEGNLHSAGRKRLTFSWNDLKKSWLIHFTRRQASDARQLKRCARSGDDSFLR